MRATHAAARATFFEYIGGGTLTVLGPMTGKRYYFAGYGARVAVDLRDRLSVGAVPHLREILSGGRDFLNPRHTRGRPA